MITKVNQWLQLLILLFVWASWNQTLAYKSSPDPISNRSSNLGIKSSTDKDPHLRSRGPVTVPKALTQHHSPLSPPFPNGKCGGRVVTLPAEEMYSTKGDGLLSFLSLPASVNNLLLIPRDISVWLPKEYDYVEFKRVYFPLLYCHDGQNGECDPLLKSVE